MSLTALVGGDDRVHEAHRAAVATALTELERYISAGTLQGFLARSKPDDPTVRHLYMVDESSLASTRQMRDFLEKIGPQDCVLLIGDTRQHQGVDAGKPFEQLQRAGMSTAQLDTIMRQKDPELLRMVEHLSKGEVALGIKLLEQQARISEVPDKAERFKRIAKDYAAKPEGTLVVPPTTPSRREINDAIRAELQRTGTVSKHEHRYTVLTPRSDMTGADRGWAAKYQPGDILFYSRGSKEHGIERASYTAVLDHRCCKDHLKVQTQDGQQVATPLFRFQRVLLKDFAVLLSSSLNMRGNSLLPLLLKLPALLVPAGCPFRLGRAKLHQTSRSYQHHCGYHCGWL